MWYNFTVGRTAARRNYLTEGIGLRSHDPNTNRVFSFRDPPSKVQSETRCCRHAFLPNALPATAQLIKQYSRGHVNPSLKVSTPPKDKRKA